MQKLVLEIKASWIQSEAEEGRTSFGIINVSAIKSEKAFIQLFGLALSSG